MFIQLENHHWCKMEWDKIIKSIAEHAEMIMERCQIQKFVIVPKIQEPPDGAIIHKEGDCTIWYLVEWADGKKPKDKSKALSSKIIVVMGCSQGGEAKFN